MRILSILCIVLVLAGVVDASQRHKRQRRAHSRPVQIIKDYGMGTFNVEKALPELRAYLNAEKIRYRVGQNAIHNKFGLVHLNAMDVSAPPNSKKGQKLSIYLRQKGIPFLSISGRKRGVSTGPHFHIGFASPRLGEKFPVGTVDGTFNTRHCPVYKAYKNRICF